MFRILHIKSYKPVCFVGIFLASLSAVFMFYGGDASAASTGFDPSDIISDGVFYNNSTMSVADIQNFLNSKVQSCDSAHNNSTYTSSNTGSTYQGPWTCLKDFYESPSTYTITFSYTDVDGTTKSDSRTYNYNNAYNYASLCPVYVGYASLTCGAGDYHSGIDHLKANILNAGGVKPSGAISAAQIIYNAAQQYGINPRVLLVLLQKEQSIVTDTWPIAAQYQSATGYGCPDFSPCSADDAGFTNQVMHAARQYQRYKNNSTAYGYLAGRNNTIKYNPDSRCGSSTVYIQNQATAGLYDYTPYQPNAYAIGGGTNSSYPSCGAFGNLNFFNLYTSWFGTTYAFTYNGVDYGTVFDPVYYLANNPDVAASCNNSQVCAFNHFISYGLYEGRQSSSDFSVFSYAYRYPDLRAVFGNNLTDYIVHYINYGRAEGRVAVGTSSLQNPIVKLSGVDYSAVYDFDYYKNNNPDLANLIGKLNDNGSLQHFVTYGMKEGRQAKASFNVHTYRENYSDLRWAFGMDLPSYYMQYIKNGQAEGRIATGTPNFIPVTSYGGIDYSSIYDYQTYISSYPNIKNALGDAYDDTGALLNFINSGMDNGRVASTNFNVNYYRDRYPDLRAAFGSNLKAYYMHYLTKGKSEGRVADTDYYGGTTTLNGVNYSAVYDFNYYYTHQPDVAQAIGLNDVAILQHFVTYGMKEGRQASANFNVFAYKNRYTDLQNAFGNNLPSYYMHYINYGQAEGRVAT